MAIYFFDMDGTLTPSRKKMQHDIAVRLGQLSTLAKIGIVTGSGMDYVVEQCKMLEEVFVINWDNINFLPCNGTQWYVWDNNKFVTKHKADMRSKVGKENYKLLISYLSAAQSAATINELDDLDVTGTFIQYRNSLVNWCPIGRNSGDAEREAFVSLDEKTGFRDSQIKAIREFFDKEKIDSLIIAKGGDTSFDIYPVGWDKTYALQHFDESDVSFVGDRCSGNGNDATIYNACLPKGFETAGPEETKQIIQRFIDAEQDKIRQ